MRISLVIPVFNEAESLPPLWEKITAALAAAGEFEAVFVNDGSTDGSLEVLRKLAAADRRVKVVTFRRNFGQTAAIAAGVDRAHGEVIVPMDADLENDPADIPKLIAKLDEGYDIVSGWRQERWTENPVTRRLTSLAANWLISRVSKVHLHDYGCTMKAYRADIIKGVRLYGEMHRFIPALAGWQGARVAELSVAYRPRQFGASKYGISRIPKVLLDLVTLKFLNDYSAKPMYFFGKIGFWSFAVGVLAAAIAVYFKATGQKDFVETPLPVLTALFVLVGVLLVLIGLLAELVMRMHHEAQNKPIYAVKEEINF
ncbi:MAG: glycosyl transferase family protein [Parcubacteria group bacterium Gr01-1014_31]|nr:MAG: glycosyl transferase family protein [Parcubacteria group bacterium Gr01-1014_31]